MCKERERERERDERERERVRDEREIERERERLHLIMNERKRSPIYKLFYKAFQSSFKMISTIEAITIFETSTNIIKLVTFILNLVSKFDRLHIRINGRKRSPIYKLFFKAFQSSFKTISTIEAITIFETSTNIP